MMKASIILTLLIMQLNCGSSNDTNTITPIPPVTSDIDFWLTKGDQTVALQNKRALIHLQQQVIHIKILLLMTPKCFKQLTVLDLL